MGIFPHILLVATLLKVESISASNNHAERPSTFHKVNKEPGIVSKVNNLNSLQDAVDDVPTHVIEARMQWQARHGQDENFVDWHHHQVEMPPLVASVQDLTREHLAEVKAHALAGDSGNSGSSSKKTDLLDRSGINFVDLGKAKHKSAVEHYATMSPSSGLFLSDNGESELLLWLNSAKGVDVDPRGNVIRWRDLSADAIRGGGGDASSYDFTPTIDQHIYRKTKKLRGASGDHGSQHPVWVIDAEGKPAVQFPCAMVNENLRLRAPMTLFTILRPIQLGNARLGGHHAEGQRFFGSYPDGQFRFDGGVLDLFTGGEHLTLDGASFKIPAGTMSLLKYRIHLHKVEISIGSRPFKEVRVSSSGARMRHPSFSDSQVSVGGVRGKCGYDGEAYEFMLFNGALSDKSADRVTSYLLEKWNLDGKPNTVDSSDTALEAQISDYSYAYAPFAGAKPKSIGNAAATSNSDGALPVNLESDTSVFKWDPPAEVPKEARLQWSKAKRDILDEIRKFQQGGNALVTFLREKDQNLRRLQREIFAGMRYIPAQQQSEQENNGGLSDVHEDRNEALTDKKIPSPCGSIPYPGGKLSSLSAPECATAIMRQQWDKKYHDVMLKLKDFQAGGKALKKFIAVLQTNLQDIWESTFW